MPVEILEIIVRANIQEPGAAPAATPEQSSGEEANFNRQQLVEEAVEQMLEVLRRKEER